MVKQLCVSILIALLLFQSIDSFIAVTYYKINKKYITDFFCVNKLKPEMQCHGKCYLNTNLVKQEKDNQKPIINFENEPIKCFYFINVLPIEKEVDKDIFLGFVYLFYIPEPFDLEVFHPPPFLA